MHATDATSAPPAGDNRIRWLCVAFTVFIAARGLGTAGFPTSALYAALLVGVGYALIARRRPLDVPATAMTFGQAVIGVTLGAQLDAATVGTVTSNWLAVSTVTLATLAVSLGVGVGVARLTGIGLATGTLGLVAGGATGIVAIADELGADSRLVAFMQYARLLVVVLLAPLVATSLAGTGRDDVSHVRADGGDLVADLVLTLGCALAGVLMARRIHFAAGALLWPLAVAAVVSVSGLAGDAGVPGLVASLAFTVVGLQVGLRFTVATVREARALLPWVLGAIGVLVVACAALAALLVPLAHVTFADAYLATTPGGLFVVAAAASVSANASFVVSVQALRVLVMIVTAAPLVRLIGRWDTSTRPRATDASTSLTEKLTDAP